MVAVQAKVIWGRCEKIVKMGIGDGEDVIWVLMVQY
jgi:hypothetical protein